MPHPIVIDVVWIAVSGVRRGITLLCAGVLVSLPGCHRSPTPPRHPHVLLITLDTTRADFLGCYGRANAYSPNIDALAARSIVFTRAYTPVPITLPAHTSLLTGVLPIRHGVRINGAFDLPTTIPTLAESLRDAGYRTAAVVGAFPLLARFHLNRGFEVYDDKFPYHELKGVAGKIDVSEKPIRVRSNERDAKAVVDRALEWLKGVPSGARWFLWTHFFDPHDPYEPPARWSQLGEGGVRDLYQGEIAWVDEQLGRVFQYLAQKDLTEETLIILVGDHGEALGDHGERTHSYFVYDETIRVPFIMALPREGPRRVDTAVSLIDVLPTVVARLELPLPAAAAIDGRSLLPLARGKHEDSIPITSESLLPAEEYGFAPLYSLRSGRWKYIQAPTAELYDLEVDPAEQRNVAASRPDLVNELAARLEEVLSPARSTGEPASRSVDPSLRKSLTSLGYARVGAPLDDRARSQRDPKDMLPLYLELRRATALATGSARLKEAMVRLEKIRPDFAGSVVYHVELGSLYYRDGQVDKALKEFRAVLAISPRYVNANLNVGNLLYGNGKYREAIPYFERVIEIDHDKWEAYIPLCVSLARTQGDVSRIKRLAQEVLTLDLPAIEADRARALLTALERPQRP